MDENSRFTLLIVDDEKTNLDVLTHILRNDYTIMIAKSGKMALKLAAEKKPDLILLDIVMPDISGFDVLVELKRVESTQSIPVIFITGLNTAKDEAKGFILGAVDYISKPFNNTIVKARVNTHAQIIRQMRTIERLTMLDALTNISNRRNYHLHLYSAWEEAIRKAGPIAMLMIDVDHFKKYNDTYGHPQGDAVLKALATVFVSSLPRETDLAARIGGEEFAVILPDTSLEKALEIAEDIRMRAEALNVPNLADNSDTHVTVSIGAACVTPSPADMDAVDKLASQADAALYKAKASGRNCVYS